MNIETEFLEDQQIKITVEVDADQLEASKRKAAKKIARRIKVPGFRPGKAPYQVIRRQIGDEALLEESLEILVNDIYPKVIEETEIEPYGPGNLENVVSLDPMTLEFVIPLMAEVEIGDYQSIRLPYEPPEVTDQDVEAVELDFRQRQAIEETVDREAGVGDRLSLRLSAKRFEEDEDNEDSSEADLIEERSTSVIIADDQDDTGNEWPFSGFSRELVGMSTGDDKTLVYTFPEDSPFENLRDVNAEFSIHIEDVKSRVLPELNDEFAQSLGEYEDLDALQKDIRESLEQRGLEAYNSVYDDQVIGQIVEGSTIKYPPQMKENEITNIIQQLESRLGNQGLDMDIYLKTREMDAQGLRDEAEPVADSRVKRSLVLLEIAQKEEIDISESELQEETTRTLASITRFMSESDRKQFDEPNAIMNLTGNIYAELRINRTIEYLRSVANGEAEAEVEQESDAPEPQDTSEEPSDEAQAAGDETISSEVEEESESEDIESIDSEPDVTEDESPETEGEKDTDG
ncbi:MAG TPA: trigger factor [Anaerolineales bacterium]|nr:trigger factor [Anaerolineales bacterium]